MGTSGWSYPEWVGHLYPNGTSPARMLAFYARLFPTVEAHSTYRRLPTISTVERWVKDVPPWFEFAPKAHLGITHRRDLDGLEKRMTAFVDAVTPLGDHLGPVLFSLPHAQPDLERLDRLLAALPSPARLAAAFELSPAWVTPDVVRRLEKAGTTLVLVEKDGHPAPDLEIGPFTYIRLRRSRYTRADLEEWVERLQHITANGRDAYVYFKHDEAGDGPRYARRVMGRLNQS